MSTRTMTVGVFGGGEWGVALASAAARAGNTALVCTRRESDVAVDGVRFTTELGELGSQATLILLAVPSTVARSVARALGDVVDGRHFVVHGVRGLSGEGLRPISAIVREETAVRRVGALAGPVLAADLLAGRPGVIAVASHFPEVVGAVQQGLGSELLRVSETHDLTGLEWSSALVGALLVGLGYARAVGVDGGLVAGMLTRAMHEAARIGVAAGADETTFYGVAGFGDLMGAMLQQDARPEVHLGRMLGEGMALESALAKLDARIEAVDLLPRVREFARTHGVAAPVFDTLDDVIRGVTDRTQILPRLMRRPTPR